MEDLVYSFAYLHSNHHAISLIRKFYNEYQSFIKNTVTAITTAFFCTTKIAGHFHHRFVILHYRIKKVYPPGEM